MEKEDLIKKIFIQLTDHEARISVLEKPAASQVAGIVSVNGKQRMLREMVKGRKFKNGQEQVAIIVGYYEKVLGTLIDKDDIRTEWIDAKMTRKYAAEFVARAKGVLIRVNQEGMCDLTQTGEDFFDTFLKNEPDTSASK